METCRFNQIPIEPFRVLCRNEIINPTRKWIECERESDFLLLLFFFFFIIRAHSFEAIDCLENDYRWGMIRHLRNAKWSSARQKTSLNHRQQHDIDGFAGHRPRRVNLSWTFFVYPFMILAPRLDLNPDPNVWSIREWFMISISASRFVRFHCDWATGELRNLSTNKSSKRISKRKCERTINQPARPVNQSTTIWIFNLKI